MGKKIQAEAEQTGTHKNTKANRFQNFVQVQDNNKKTWPTDAVVYIGHLPHGFLEQQLKSYFSQYGEVLAVKVARSKKTARSKGYAFVQFRYTEVAQIVSSTMKGYLLLGKVLTAQTLAANQKNPFQYSSAARYKYINWKQLYIKKQNKSKTQDQTAHIIHNLLKNEEKRKEKLKSLGIQYDYPGFTSLVPKVQVKKAVVVEKKKKSSK